MNERGTKLEAVFHAALELTPAEDRERYLAEACAGDPELRREVDGLLKSAAGADAVFQAGQAACRLNSSPHSVDLTEKPGDRIGRYKLLQQIGEGGCGVVYMAEQEEPVRRKVALKIIKLGMDTKQVVARFEAERQALALMDHPNIAKVLDAGATESGRPYFVMELVRGIKITTYADDNSLSTAARLDLFMQVCKAVQHAHQKGIIHRDIKPSNVLVADHDAVPIPKIIDFGIAKATTDQRLTDKTVFTAFEQFIGTPAYMSPEQAKLSGLDVDTRTDIYSLGVLLYELLTGRTPLDQQELLAAGLEEMRRQIREVEPPRPSTRLSTMAGESLTSTAKHRQIDAPRLIQQVRGDLDWIVMKCLEKDRTRRYDTANGLAADIQRHINNEPVVARPPSAAYRFQKAFRRNKLLFTAGTVIVVTLVLGVIGTTIGLLRAEKLRQAAEQKQTEAEAERQRAETEQQRANTQAQKASESEQKSRRFLYAAGMNLAQQALKVNNLGRARRLLDRHRPNPGEEDLRGWEWRYLWQLTRGNVPVTLTNRPTPGFSVGFSPDGKSLTVGWWDGRVDLWDVQARRWVRALTEGERPHPGRVAFSPVRNLLAATSEPNSVTLYDLDSGRESILWRGTDDAEWEVRDLSFSQDGSKLVIYAGSNPEAGDAVWVVDASSSRIENHYPAGRSRKEWAHIGAARLSPDNRRLYWVRSDDWNGRIQCIDLGTNQELWHTEWQGEPLMSLDISGDGRVLASVSGFGHTTIHLWDTATGGELLKPLERHTASVCDLAFTRDGRRLISAGGDQTIRFWDTSTWTETQVLRGHNDEVWAVAISESAQLIASVSKDGDLKLWRMDEKRAADGYRSLLQSWGDDVQPLDHSRVLLLSPGQPPELVDLKRDSPPLPLPEIGSSDNVLGCFHTNLLCVLNVINGPLGTNLLSNGSFSNGLTGWVPEQHDNAHASFTRTFDFTNNQPSVKVSVTNADTTGWYIQLNYPNLKLASNLVYTISFAAKATPATNAEVAVTQAHPDWLGLGYSRSLSLATNWQWFTNTFQPSAGDTNARVSLRGMGDKLAAFWFADVRLQALQARTNHANQILIGELLGSEFVQRGAVTLNSGLRPTGLAYNPARRLLAWSDGTSSRSIYLASLDKSNWAAGRRIELTSDVPGLVPFRFSADGNYLAAAREPHILRIWNVETGQIVRSINQNFIEEHGVNAAQRTCFAANGSVLVVARHYRVREEIAFFNLDRPDLPRRVPGGFVDQTLAVSPNGELVAASSLDGQVRLFDAAAGKQIDSFYGHHPSAIGVAFSPDGRRLISSCRGREAVKLWDVGTGQELLTLAGANDYLFLYNARWSTDGDVILAGPPWQAWIAPSWEEIAAAEAKDKTETK